MEVNLLHHGYNVERRKMYPTNPRNNLVSTVDFVWEKSLEKEQKYPNHLPQIKKKYEKEEINHSYNRAVNSVIERERSLDRSTFRVMPVHPIENKSARGKLSDSLSNEVSSFKERGQTQSFRQEGRYPSQVARNHLFDQQHRKNKPIQNSSSVSSTVFGYNINYDNFKKESYLSKLMSDRLEPYLSKTIENRIPKHSSMAINNPVPIYYQ